MQHRHLPRSLARFAPVAAAILGSAALAAPAGAAVADPNSAIIVTSNASDLLLGGVEGMGVTLERPTIGGGTTVIATATSGADPAANPAVGESGVNSGHFVGTPSNGCWDVFTPQLLPGDIITLANGDSTVVQGVTAEAMQVSGNTLIVHGTAADENGAPLPADEIDAQLHAPGVAKFSTASAGGSRQFISAQRGDSGGTITYDAPGSTHWTARFPAVGSGDVALAQAGPTVGAWTGPAAATGGGEETDFEVGAPAGPDADCPGSPYGANEARGASVKQINAASTAGGITLNGVTQPGGNAVTATLTDANGKTISVPATGSGTWTATVTGAQLAGLADGAMTVGGTYSNGAGTFKGATVSGLVSKDTVAPSAVRSSVASGAYSSTQNVALSSSDGTIRYTTDGSEPSASSKSYSGPISVAQSQTIKAIAIDGAGNASPVSQFDYAINPPVVQAPSKPTVAALPKLKIESLTFTKKMSLRSARKSGFSSIIYAPEGAKIAHIRILKGAKVIQTINRKISRDGVLEVRMPSKKALRKKLQRGSYRVEIQVGQSLDNLGAKLVRTIRLK